jgi:undecaprenyl-diphosphatase
MLAFAILILVIRKTRRIGITLMILIVISTLLTGYIKCGVDRDRPDFEYEGTPFPVPISQDTFALFCEGGYDASFPSGHAARSMIFAIIFGYALSERFPRGAYLMFLYPAMISLSRVYVLQHFPMDVIGGSIIGIMLAGVMAQRTKLYQYFGKSKT